MGKYYIAYGSNLNFEQMSRRCPSAKFIGKGVIEDYQLIFCSVATIIPAEGSIVPVGVWLIEDQDEEELDIYEGYPKLYGKETIYVSGIDGVKEGMVYIMNDYNPTLPSAYYYRIIEKGYEDVGLQKELLHLAIEKTKERIVSIQI